MTVQPLLYNHKGTTFGILADASMLDNFRNGSAPAAEVMDVFEVFAYAKGKQGNMLRPGKIELEQAFGTSKLDDVVEFILKNGSLDKKNKKKGKKEPAISGLNSRMHVPHSRVL